MKAITKHLRPNIGTWIIVGLLVIVGVLFLAQSVDALPGAAPAEPLAPSQTLISYQGTLTDKSGNPLNRIVTMVFALYDAATGGNRLWGPETQSVAVSEGLFHVLLGSMTPMDPATLMGDLHLSIKVNGEEMSPRERLTSTAYSISALRGTGYPFVVDADLTVQGDINLTDNARLRSDLEYIGFFKSSTAAAEGVRAGQLGIDNSYANADSKLDALGGNSLWVKDHLQVNGRIGVGTGGPFHGQVMIETNAVPLAFKEADLSGAGSLWRMPLDGTALRFDASQTGTDWSAYTTPLTLHADGSISCGALTEANLQTPEERAAGGSDRFEEGDLLCWGDGQLEKCDTANDPLVQAVADKGGRPIVIGAELVKVVGPVKKGDFLVASDVPGYAMAARSPAFGTVIAQALEDLNGEKGIIKAMIRKF